MSIELHDDDDPVEQWELEEQQVEAPSFAVIPTPLLMDRRLSDKAVRAYGFLQQRGGKRGESWWSQRKMAGEFDWSVATLRRAIHELEQCGYVTVEVRIRDDGSQGSNRYVLTPSGLNTPPAKSEYPPPHQRATKETNKQKQTNRNSSVEAAPLLSVLPSEQTEQRESADRLVSEIFERAWAVYPRKVNKAGAKQKFIARVKQGVSPGELLTAVRNYAAFIERKQKQDRTFSSEYVLHGATFFGPQQRWRDYLPSAEEAETPEMYDEDGEELTPAQKAGRWLREHGE